MAKRSRARHTQRNNLKKLKQQVLKSGVLKGENIRFVDSSQNKISAALLKFIEPYTALADHREAYERLVAMAATAWNATLMDSESRRRLLDEFEIITLAGEDKKTHTEIMKLMKAMIERKERFFSGDKRFVMDFSVTETRDGYRLAVAAAPIGDDTSS